MSLFHTNMRTVSKCWINNTLSIFTLHFVEWNGNIKSVRNLQNLTSESHIILKNKSFLLLIYLFIKFYPFFTFYTFWYFFSKVMYYLEVWFLKICKKLKTGRRRKQFFFNLEVEFVAGNQIFSYLKNPAFSKEKDGNYARMLIIYLHLT